MAQPAAVHMHGAEFRAAVQGGHRLARVEETLGVPASLMPWKIESSFGLNCTHI
jgi:hypothetical protein